MPDDLWLGGECRSGRMPFRQALPGGSQQTERQERLTAACSGIADKLRQPRSGRQGARGAAPPGGGQVLHFHLPRAHTGESVI